MSITGCAVQAGVCENVRNAAGFSPITPLHPRQYHSIHAPNSLFHSSNTDAILSLQLTASLNKTPTDRPQYFFLPAIHCPNSHCM